LVAAEDLQEEEEDLELMMLQAEVEGCPKEVVLLLAAEVTHQRIKEWHLASIEVS
jgi:hypothetical protein